MSSPGAVAAVRSFKLRRGRITDGQRAALESLWPRYGLTATGRLDQLRTFGRHAPLLLEIGFGMGESTHAMAAADPDRDVLAIEVHTPGAGALVRQLDAAGLTNVRVLVGDALPALTDLIAPDSLEEIRLFFPDPWPKLKHRKRRLYSPGFARLAASRLRAGGRLHSVTDWESYAEQMLAVVAAEPLLANSHDGYAPRSATRPVTRFEQQGLAKGHRIHEVIAVRLP